MALPVRASRGLSSTFLRRRTTDSGLGCTDAGKTVGTSTLGRESSVRGIITRGTRRWMSVRPAVNPSSSQSAISSSSPTPPRHKKVTIQSLHSMREKGIPITMLTAYDYATALALSTARIPPPSSPYPSPSSSLPISPSQISHHPATIDICLVGDSLAQVALGLPSTTLLTLDEMIHHCRAVSRGLSHPHSTKPFFVADLPFGTYQTSPEDAIRNAIRLVKEGGVEGVKMEGGEELVETVRRMTSVGIPVMAHVGLLPQRHVALSGYRVQGRDAKSAKGILDAALALEGAGAFAMVLEAIPTRLGEYITKRVGVPTIGIGAGKGTNGQVLVWDDAMGRWEGKKAKFVRRFAQVGERETEGVGEYARAVKDGSFPSREESYEMPEEEFQRLLAEVGKAETQPESR